jgi:hypothetical protein
MTEEKKKKTEKEEVKVESEEKTAADIYKEKEEIIEIEEAEKTGYAPKEGPGEITPDKAHITDRTVAGILVEVKRQEFYKESAKLGDKDSIRNFISKKFLGDLQKLVSLGYAKNLEKVMENLTKKVLKEYKKDESTQ